eukprot:Hpha_TRINITY_DN14019_c0_g1::TRINITY_DN14019_c0_g1_i1::g.43823::m.43823
MQARAVLRDALLFESAAERQNEMSKALSDLEVTELRSLMLSPCSSRGARPRINATGGSDPERRQGRGRRDRSAEESWEGERSLEHRFGGSAVFNASTYDHAVRALGAACAERAKLREGRALHDLRMDDQRCTTNLSALRPGRQRSQSQPPRVSFRDEAPSAVSAASTRFDSSIGGESYQNFLEDALEMQMRRFLRQQRNFVLQERNLEALRREEKEKMRRTYSSIARKNAVAERMVVYRERWAAMCRRAADAEAMRREQLRESEFTARCTAGREQAERVLLRGGR